MPEEQEMAQSRGRSALIEASETLGLSYRAAVKPVLLSHALYNGVADLTRNEYVVLL